MRSSQSSSSEMKTVDAGLILAIMYRHPWDEFEMTSGPFHTKDLDICGKVNCFVPFVILKHIFNKYMFSLFCFRYI